MTGNMTIKEGITGFLLDKGKGEGSETGNYRADAQRELDRFLAWLRTDLEADDPDHIPTFHDLDERTFRRYARNLVSKGYTPGTTKTYYAYVASFCGWAVDEGLIDRHYANTSRARAPLPDDDQRRSGDQQAWEPEHRDRLTRHVDQAVTDALDDYDGDAPPGERNEYAAIRAFRDRALVYILSYTAVRAAEVFRDHDDDRRRGLQWGDLRLSDNSMTVFRKTQQWDDAALPEPVIHPLRSYEKLLSPPRDEWPVFPTFHYPTLGKLVRGELADLGWGESNIESIRNTYENDLIVAREYNLGPPPSIATDAARRRMKKLCEAAGIEIDDQHGYLAPHGGRRGMGEVLVRQSGYAAAARYLDNSEQMVREAYSHIEANERADIATEGLAATDQRVRTPETNNESEDMALRERSSNLQDDPEEADEAESASDQD